MASFSARELISKAYTLSGIVSADLSTVSGSQLTEGLSLLNDLLAVEGVTGMLISYYKEFIFNTVPAQEKYFIPGALEVETVTFNIDNVRYSTRNVGRTMYFGSARADNIESLPFNWHIERVLDGIDLYMYYLPDRIYPIKVWGKFGLTEIPFADLDVDLLLTYDRYFTVYMRYALARYIAEQYNINLPPQTLMSLATLENKLLYVSPKDYSLRKDSTLQVDTALNYGDVNIGKGWRPS